jgi:puromycin-sensitive aminopeptidase
VSASPENPYRLPTSVRPTHYELTLVPDLDAARFTGEVTITLEVREPVREVRFNTLDLVLEPVTFTGADGRTQSARAVADPEREWATVSLDEPLAAGAATLSVRFAGVLNDQLAGFYRSTYEDDRGATRTIATTQFEATDARRAFPCWDEPTFKATFSVTLTVPSHLAAYSNGPVVEETDHGDGTRTVRFARTMKMSTYLVAFVVGPFEQTAPVDVLGTPLRVVCPEGKVHLADFALEAGRYALEFFTDYFAIAYPGDKLDLVAVPDFAFGAMENLGCVTFRESALLVDPALASLAEMERVAEIVAHEIAHMWFGDLVTMSWWEGIWLNEAFATFMETLCVSHFRPQWKKWLSFATSRDAALQVDGLHSTRAIEYEVVAPTDMRGMFDVLTYEKGGAVLRMLEQFLGEDVFRDGIRLYLRTHAYANTVTGDLWAALETVSAQPVREMMDTWILQGGHPLVTYQDGQLRQAPFSYRPADGAPSAIGEHWLTPVMTRRLNGGPTSRVLLGDEPVALDADGPIVVNAGGWGVFRTTYGSAELAGVASALDRLDELERTVLVADAWAALLASRIRWSDFVTLVRGLGEQDEPATWSTVAHAFDMASRAATDEQRGRLADTVREVFGPPFARLGWAPAPGESELAPQMRAIVIGALGTFGRDEQVRDEARRLFDAGVLDGDIARAVLRVVADDARPGDYTTFLDRYRAAANPQDKQRYQWGLADFADEASALDAAERCFSEFRGQDAPIVLGLLERNRVSGPAVWRYLTSRWDDALATFPPLVHSRMVGGIATFIADRDFAAEVDAFHRSHPIAGEQRTVEQLLERLRIGLDFADALRSQL